MYDILELNDKLLTELRQIAKDLNINLSDADRAKIQSLMDKISISSASKLIRNKNLYIKF